MEKFSFLWKAKIEYCFIEGENCFVLIKINNKAQNIYDSDVKVKLVQSRHCIGYYKHYCYRQLYKEDYCVSFSYFIHFNGQIDIFKENSNLSQIKFVKKKEDYLNFPNVICLYYDFIVKPFIYLINLVKFKYKWSIKETKKILQIIKNYCLKDRLSLEDRKKEKKILLKKISELEKKYIYKVCGNDVFLLKNSKFQLIRYSKNIKKDCFGASTIEFYIVYLILCLKEKKIKASKDVLNLIYCFICA